MIKYILLTLLLLYFISKICYTEYFENKLSEHSININQNSDKTKCHSYKFYNNNTLLVESDICKSISLGLTTFLSNLHIIFLSENDINFFKKLFTEIC